MDCDLGKDAPLIQSLEQSVEAAKAIDEAEEDNLAMSVHTQIKFNKGLKEILQLDGRIDMSTEKDRVLGAELESQISALEQSYEDLATLHQVQTT